MPVTATLDSIGVNVISFRYETAYGQVIDLDSYNSVYGELFEDPTALNFTVSAELQMVDVLEKPDHGDFFYGNEIVFK